MNELFFFAPGVPGAKGSKSFKGMGRRANGTQFARLIESSKKVKPWEEAVCAALFPRQPVEMFRGAVHVELEFLFTRPPSHGKQRPPAWNKLTGDADKLARSTLDALTRAGAWGDDSQVIRLTSSKRYCNAGEVPGCLIRVTDPSPGLIKPQPKGKRDARQREGQEVDAGAGRRGGGTRRRRRDPQAAHALLL